MTALADASIEELRALELTYAGLSDLAGAHLRDELDWKAAAVADELQRRAQDACPASA